MSTMIAAAPSETKKGRRETHRDRLAMLSTVINADADALYLRDADGVCTMANASLASTLGVPSQSFLERSVAQIFPPEIADAILELEALAFASGEPQSCELAIPTAQGKRPFLVTHGVCRDASGAVAGVFGRLRDLSDQKRLEREVVEIAEREMRRIAADLHDDLCQGLAAVSLISKLLEKKLEDDGSAKIAGHIADLTKNLAVSTRNLAHNLAPTHLSGENFIDYLRASAAEFCAAFRLKCGIEGVWPAQLTEPAVALHVYRIIQEAMHNAAKHGGGTCITVRLRTFEGAFTVSVSDNGQGFTPDACGTEGMGLNTMNYRAGLLGGTLAIESVPGCGTTVTCRLPLGAR
ncbi:MAG: ATP-binding protein [Verrucomicrobiota bacterium]